ncbi:hypothetical protein V6N13_022953 [Hibiscus sabdariffa]|uniref:VQ domain-containing protein n=2 Tax=Hibiscus sabdariffa TaxID=183260 RepID=A0ABR2NU29_9ROSI
MDPSGSTPAAVSMKRDSKANPKIRIIHVCAREIITTDVANFRELLQRLTGKPPQEKKARQWKMEPRRGFETGEEGNPCGFLSGLGDLEGFFQQLSEFPLDQMHGVGEAQLV